MVGESQPPRGLARLREPLPQRLMRATPAGVDVRIVADRGRQEEADDDRVSASLRRRRARRWPRGRIPDRPLAGCAAAAPSGRTSVHQILLPFTGRAISRRALDAALRIARAENATLMPAYLAIVPMQLPLDAPRAEAAKACRCSRRSSSGAPPRAFR